MQRLKVDGLAGPLVADAERLFAWGSSWPLPASAPLSSEWADTLAAIGRAAGVIVKPEGGPAAEIPSKLDPRKALVLFSGGKDSLAAALALRAEGLAPALLYVRGMNGSAYAHEEHAARELAAIASFPIRIVTVHKTGKSAHTENPTKNLVLAAIGAAAARSWGAGLVAMGLLTEDAAYALNVRCGLSDNPRVAEPAALAIQALSGVHVRMCLHANDAASFARVWKECRAAVPALSSCLGTARFKGSLATRNSAKFGIKLMPGRCGSCYKCALELVALAALEGHRLSPALSRHCLDKLSGGLQTITGSPAKRSPAKTLAAFFGEGEAYKKATYALTMK